MDWMTEATEPVYETLRSKGKEKLARMYRQCFRSTWDTTLRRAGDTMFLITGDIPAMWLRDSSAQVYHYLPYAPEYPEVAEVIQGLLKRQFQYIMIDPYANAFNQEADGKPAFEDRTGWTEEQKPWIWERKYEVDSLCYPIRLAYACWKQTGSTAWCNELFRSAAQTILGVWETEQHHMEQSPYYFERSDCPASDTLPEAGRGTPVAWTGMTWSGFRPSDDACRYGYLIPSNFFAAESLRQIGEMTEKILRDEELSARAERLRHQILQGLKQHAVVHHPEYGDVYVYETDGRGHYHLMDDANVPSLLSLPYLGCVPLDDPVYQNTRRMILSPENPYYFRGKYIRGIGSPHTPRGYVWPISLCVQGLTTEDGQEISELLNMLERTDAGTGLMHEGIWMDDPGQFTRPWFAWANSIFSEFAEKALQYME